MQSLASEINFCSLANRTCSSELNGFKPFAAVYQIYKGLDVESPINVKVDSSSFFRESTLKFGNKIHLPKSQDQFPERALLPVEGLKIGCHEKKLQKLLSQPVTFASKKAIQSTLLDYCSVLKGSASESCPKSLEGMIEFSKTALGGKHFVALSTKSTKVLDANKELVIGEVKKLKVDKMVSCHGILLDTATYFCHSMSSSTPVYIVDVIDPQTKAPINTVLATCHLDTSAWSEDHVAFEMLKSSPGKIEACHFNTDLDILWVGDH
jgi:hypothetical protein